MVNKINLLTKLILVVTLTIGFWKVDSFALDKKASSTLSHYILALMYDRMGNLDIAISEYKKALILDYNNPDIHSNLGVTYLKQNAIQKAIKEFILASNFDTEAVEPHAILALLYFADNKIEEASGEYEIALKNAIKRDPQNTSIYRSLGALYLKQKKYAAAEKSFKSILEVAPKDYEAHFFLANVYDETDKDQLAEEELKKSLNINNNYAEALNYLGYLYVEQNKNLKEAEGLIEKALKSEPENGAFIDSLGWLYFKQGNFEQAIKMLEKASKLVEDPIILDHLGEAYFKINNFEKAKVSWKKSLELDKTQTNVKNKLEKIESKR